MRLHQRLKVGGADRLSDLLGATADGRRHAAFDLGIDRDGVQYAIGIGVLLAQRTPQPLAHVFSQELGVLGLVGVVGQHLENQGHVAEWRPLPAGDCVAPFGSGPG